MDFPRFELVTQYQEQKDLLPKRATIDSAGYDFKAAEDILIPAYFKPEGKGYNFLNNELLLSNNPEPYTLNEISAMTKMHGIKPTLVPTGIKAYIPREMYLQIQVRSSLPLKHWLIQANAPGIIDSDYYNNPDNEGHIFFQLINLSPRDIVIQRGERIGQGIFLPYYTLSGDFVHNQRTGGFGSTI